MKYIIPCISGIIMGISIWVVAQHSDQPTEQEKITAYYQNAAATLVSPHHLRQEIDKGHDDFVLVDLRTAAEYEEEHVIGAINVDASQTQEQIVAAFTTLQIENPDKEIIIYCYSAACMTGRKVGAMLANEGIFVKEMTIGWNEWRYDFMSWNYPSEWDSLDPMRYIATGTEPGVLDISDQPLPACAIEGEFGC